MLAAVPLVSTADRCPLKGVATSGADGPFVATGLHTGILHEGMKGGRFHVIQRARLQCLQERWHRDSEALGAAPKSVQMNRHLRIAGAVSHPVPL